MSVTLVDNVKRKEDEAASNALQIVHNGGLKKIDGTWQRVVMPLERFTRGKPLQLTKLWEIDFANTGKDALTFDIDRIGFIVEKPAPFKPAAAFRAKAHVDPHKDLHAIRDAIYGVAGLPREQLIAFAVPITRWGGNTSTRYNWKLNVDNGASDWYFKNRGKIIDRLADTGYLKLIQSNKAIGANAYVTLPMIGWVSKDATSYGFSVAKYGKQKATEPGHPDVGDGIKPGGGFITSNDPHDTSIEAPAEFVGEAVKFVAAEAGKADAGGVKYWVLDNEPMLWNSTHRDVHPKPLTYDGLWEKTVKYGEAIKRADPSAKVAGFCSWGWMDLFYSAADAGTDDYQTKPDWAAHGKVGLCEWFLKKCAEYKKAHDGKALVDVLDLHWLSAGPGRWPGCLSGTRQRSGIVYIASAFHTRPLGQELMNKNRGYAKPGTILP